MQNLSQGQRALRVLADGKWHSVSEIHRKAGTMRLNSRISDLRKQGYIIECERVKGRRGPSAYRYRVLNPPPREPSMQIWDGEPLTPEAVAPRDKANRFRIYVVPRYGEQRLISTAPDEAGVGVALCTLGREGELAGCCVGVLDTFGEEENPGEWLLNPHEARW